MGRRPERRDLSRAAKEALGYPSLRSGQPEALEVTLSGRDVLAVMPTGHGKSALHQLPAALAQRHLRGRSAAASDATHPAADLEEPFPVGREVDHREWGAGLVMSTEPDRVTVLFESEGYRTLSLDAVQEEDLLSLR